MTPPIAVLPGDVINKIAAGEVVERPASVVKELVENAIDAGATRVSVDVSQVGRRAIRVTDNGQGIASEEAALAFQRHATSKIRTEADLSTIQSMGFRGEALPSIAAVSKVRLVTVAAGSSMGTEVRLEGGALLAQRETAAAPGTTVEVTDLFYNTPARKKFLKSPATEFGHVCQAVQRQALAFPKIHFRLTHNGHMVADYPAVRTLRDHVQQVYGAQLVDTCVDLQEEAGRLRLEGLCTRPLETAHATRPPGMPTQHRTCWPACNRAWRGWRSWGRRIGRRWTRRRFGRWGRSPTGTWSPRSAMSCRSWISTPRTSGCCSSACCGSSTLARSPPNRRSCRRSWSCPPPKPSRSARILRTWAASGSRSRSSVKAASSCGPCRRSSAKATSGHCCARWWKIGTRGPRRLRCRSATIPSSRPWRATARCGRDGRWKSRRCGGCWRTGARRGCPARARTGAASPCA